MTVVRRCSARAAASVRSATGGFLVFTEVLVGVGVGVWAFVSIENASESSRRAASAHIDRDMLLSPDVYLREASKDVQPFARLLAGKVPASL